jgi:hypothetical protein
MVVSLCHPLWSYSTLHSLSSSKDSKECWYREIHFYRHWAMLWTVGLNWDVVANARKLRECKNANANRMQLLNQCVSVRQCILHCLLTDCPLTWN